MSRGLDLAPHLLRRSARLCVRRFGMRDEHASVAGRVVPGRDRGRELTVAHGTIQSRRATSRQRHTGEVERGRIRMRQHGCAPSEGDLLLRDIALPFARAESRQRALRRTRDARHRTIPQPPVPCMHLAPYDIRIDVADDRKDRVRRLIPGAVERIQLRLRQRAQTSFFANAPSAYPVMVVQQGVQRFDRHGPRRITLALRLLNDHLELACEFVGVDQ